MPPWRPSGHPGIRPWGGDRRISSAHCCLACGHGSSHWPCARRNASHMPQIWSTVQTAAVTGFRDRAGHLLHLLQLCSTGDKNRAKRRERVRTGEKLVAKPSPMPNTWQQHWYWARCAESDGSHFHEVMTSIGRIRGAWSFGPPEACMFKNSKREKPWPYCTWPTASMGRTGFGKKPDGRQMRAPKKRAHAHSTSPFWICPGRPLPRASVPRPGAWSGCGRRSGRRP